MLGGPERRTLFICTAGSHLRMTHRRESSGKIEVMDVKAGSNVILPFNRKTHRN
jgi:hypothetical protein